MSDCNRCFADAGLLSTDASGREFATGDTDGDDRLFSVGVGNKDVLYSVTADRELYPSSSCCAGPVSEYTVSESIMHTWGTSEAKYDGGLALGSVINDCNSTGCVL